jgi:hypothetical protein
MDDPDSVQNMGYSFGDSMCVDKNESSIIINEVVFTRVNADAVYPLHSRDTNQVSTRAMINAGYKAGDVIELVYGEPLQLVQPVIAANGAGALPANQAFVAIAAAPIRQGTHICTILSLQDSELLIHPAAYTDAQFNQVSKCPGATWERANRYNGRSLLNGTHSVTFSFRPLLSILRHHLPLFLMKGGIEITFELDSAATFLSSPTGVAAEVSITNPRMMAMMVTPQQDIVNEYIREWRGDGLIYSLPCVKYRSIEDSGAANEVAHQRHVGVRSARRVYTVFQDTLTSRGTRQRYHQSLSHFIRDYVSKFHMKVGSQEFPNRDIALNENSFEMLEHLKNVSGSSCTRIQPHEWQTSPFNAASCADNSLTGPTEKHFIFAVDLSRDNGVDSELCGSDLSVVPLELVFTRSKAHTETIANGGAAWTSNLVHIGMHIEYDAFFKLSSEQVTIIN